MREFWTSRTLRERIMIIVCVLAVVIGVPLAIPTGKSAVALLSPAAAQAKLTNEQSQVANLHRQNATIRSLLTTTSYVGGPDAALPKIVEKLQADAKSAGIHIKEIKPIHPHIVDGVAKMAFDMSFSSSLGQALSFIFYLENPKGKLVIEKINLSTSETQNQQIQVTVEVAAFALAQPLS